MVELSISGTHPEVYSKLVRIVGEEYVSDDYAKKLLDKTLADKQSLEQMLADTERQIKAIHSFLDHVESDLYVAVNEGAGSARHRQVREKLDELDAGIQETAERLQASNQEVEETLGQVLPFKK